MYIIEHLEPRMYPWCVMEYKHISELVGKNNLLITNAKPTKALDSYAQIKKTSIKDLHLQNICILDPDAPKTLTLPEAKTFDHFIFGGILGDYPPKKRTKKELTPFLQGAVRNIGKKQFSTDNAVAVVKLICGGTPLEKMQFQDKLELATGKYESVILPYRYLIIENRPYVSKELLVSLRKKHGF